MVLKRLHLHTISCLHDIIKEREDAWNAISDMQCKIEKEEAFPEEPCQASPFILPPFLSGQPGILPYDFYLFSDPVYQASR